MNDWVERQLDDGVPPGEIVDGFYTEMRLRRWVGTAQEGNARNVHANLLQHPAIVTTGFAADHEQRRRDALHFDVIRRLAPELGKVPLANAAWHPDNYRDLPDADDYEAIEPIKSRAGGLPWQLASWPRFVPVFTQRLVECPPDDLAAMLDPEATATAISRFHRLGRQAQECLWATVGASVWLGDDELCARFPAATANGSARSTSPVDAYARDAIVISELRRYGALTAVTDGAAETGNVEAARVRDELERLRNRRSVKTALAVAGRYGAIKKTARAAKEALTSRRDAPEEDALGELRHPQPRIVTADDAEQP